MAGGRIKKDKEFWGRIKEWDVVGLVKTWLEIKDWKEIKKKMLMEFSWCMQEASKEKKKRRAARRIIMGIKKGLGEKKRWWRRKGG